MIPQMPHSLNPFEAGRVLKSTSQEMFLMRLRQVARAAAFILAALLIAVPAIRAQEDPVALFNQAQDRHEKGELAGAVELYDKAIGLMPEFPEAEYQRAAALESLGKKDEALKGFLRAGELRPDWALPRASAGALLIRLGRSAEAETLLAKAIELQPADPVALTALAELRIKTKAEKPVLQDLLAKITPLTEKGRPSPGLLRARAGLEVQLGMRDAANRSLERALAADPEDKNTLMQMAFAAADAGDVDRARGILTKLERLSSATDLHVLRAAILAREGKRADALKELENAPAGDEYARELRSKITDAVSTPTADLEKRLEADPANAVILGRLCRELRLSAPAKALAYCRRASEAEPNNVDHAVGFAAALVQAKQYAAAVDILRKLIAMSPENWTAHANLATALFQLARFAEAKVEYDWLAQRQPDAAVPHFFLGIVHDRLGELRPAMAEYQAYLKLADPKRDQADIDKVNLRLPALEREIKKSGK